MDFKRCRYLWIPLLPVALIITLWGIGSFGKRQSSVASEERCYLQSSIYHKENEARQEIQRDLEKNHYRAAVVEYKPIPIGDQSPTEAVLSNVRVYVDLINQAGEQNADIIVFPELGITTVDLPSEKEKAREYFVQIPPMYTIPCETKSTTKPNNGGQFQILYLLSCAARENKIYVVVNLGEFEECDSETDSNCPIDGAYNYNTNVVFDRHGAIIARYRKYHLYFEPMFDYPLLEHSSFITDFGVEFGMFICFDIIFAKPAVDLVESKGIRNFVFSTAWVDELPFLTGIQAQALWAQSNSVNLLASGYHQPENGKMGSGIYSGDGPGALSYIFDPSSGTKLLISDVPRHQEVVKSTLDYSECQVDTNRNNINYETEKSEKDHFWLREDLSNCTRKSLDPNASRDSLCYDNIFCCDIEYELISKEYSGTLTLLVFDGRRTVAAKQDWFEWQVCAVIHCLNATLESCTENVKPSTLASDGHPKFRNLTLLARPVKMDYEREGTSRPALSLLDTSFRLIPQSYFHIHQWRDDQENSEHVVLARSQPQIEKIDVKTVAIIQKVYSGRECLTCQVDH